MSPKDDMVELIVAMLKKRGWSAYFPTSCNGSRETIMEMKKLAHDPVSDANCLNAPKSFKKFFLKASV